MANCNFLKQKKQVKINGEWVDTRSYRYLPYCVSGKPCVYVRGGDSNSKVYVDVVKYDSDTISEKEMSLDENGNGYLELESDDCFKGIDTHDNYMIFDAVRINGCYVKSIGNEAFNRCEVKKMTLACSTYVGSSMNFNYDHQYTFRCFNYDVKTLDTSKVTDMYKMFILCWQLQSLDLSNFDTSNVTNMAQMFSDCTNLISLDLSGWDTSNVTNMSYMFYSCSSLSTIYMRNCSQTTIDKIKKALSDSDTQHQVTIIT